MTITEVLNKAVERATLIVGLVLALPLWAAGGVIILMWLISHDYVKVTGTGDEAP